VINLKAREAIGLTIPREVRGIVCLTTRPVFAVSGACPPRRVRLQDSPIRFAFASAPFAAEETADLRVGRDDFGLENF
jgi:hypothetical protein